MSRAAFQPMGWSGQFGKSVMHLRWIVQGRIGDAGSKFNLHGLVLLKPQGLAITRQTAAPIFFGSPRGYRFWRARNFVRVHRSCSELKTGMSSVELYPYLRA